MKYRKILLALSTTVIALTIQSCSSNHKTANQKKTTNRENDLAITTIEKSSRKNPSEYLAGFAVSKSDKLTDTARFLAGMKINEKSNLNELKDHSNWLEHHRFFSHSWSKLETQQLAKVRQWTKEKLTEINVTSPSIFYPFSGADFLYAYSLFPQSKEYILVDSEPIGTIPDLDSISESEIQDKLQAVRDFLYPLLQSSFIPASEQKIDLQKQGILPILYVFLARTNNRILDIEYVSIDRQAKIQQLREDLTPGVKINFLPENETEPRTLYYFSADLSNQGMRQYPEIVKFVSKLDKTVTYLNTASYLMYYDDFSQVKNLILSQSNYLLQDDSGMPLKSFSKNKWDLEFYGNYTNPVALFSNRYQPDLRRVYKLDKGIEPLNFGIGYKFGSNESNLMLARTKKAISR